jgi:hypothetical protein
MSASVPPAVLPAASLGVGFGGPLWAGLTASNTRLRIVAVRGWFFIVLLLLVKPLRERGGLS